MPCNSGYGNQGFGDSYTGPSYDEIRRIARQEAEKRNPRTDEERDDHTQIVLLILQLRRMEAAMCGMCQTLERENIKLHPELQAWFTNHKAQPGCDLNPNKQT